MNLQVLHGDRGLEEVVYISVNIHGLALLGVCFKKWYLYLYKYVMYKYMWCVEYMILYTHINTMCMIYNVNKCLYMMCRHMYLHIIYRHLLIKCGNCKGKYDGLAEGFSMLRVTEKTACSVNVSTKNFEGTFTSTSIVNEWYCYNLLLEQQLVAEVIFLCLILLWQQDVSWSSEKEATNSWKMRVRPSEKSPEKGRGREWGVEKRWQVG